ncbi:MAG: N-acetylmuramoyl-L-alanine amidase [Eubacterium sp.]
MYQYKKLATLILTASIIAGLTPIHIVPAQSVTAEQTKAVPETISEISTEPEATAQPVTEQPAIPEPTTTEFIQSTLSPVKAKTIVLDPGHCNKHRGASCAGLREERVVLDIAKACKNELDQYGDINVYMTRTSNKCPQSIAPGDCLIARNYFSKLLRADSLISMHIDFDKGSGAKILVPYKSGYNDSVRKKSRKLGSKILTELHNIGLKNKGFLLRKSSKYVRYKNGKRADYYSIVRNGVKLNIPSIIIEHGYINRASERNKYFRTKQQRITVGTADAKAIISYYNLSARTISGNFSKIGSNMYYVTDTSQKVRGWVKSEGKWYYFDETTGKMKKGFVTIGKNTFYFKPSTGEMTVGWFKVKGSTYLSRGNGTLVKNQKYSDGYYKYTFNAKGKRLKKISRVK